ncbi:MAG: hypothetical protein IJU95_07995 [Treponema sp.]|nr:hypothetical protein [Treponema sp.]
MSLTEFDQEEYDRNRREEGWEEGFEDGERSKAQESARNLLKMGLGTHEQISQATGLSVEDIRALATAMPLEPVLA